MGEDVKWARYWATVGATAAVLVPAKGTALATGPLVGRVRASGRVRIQPTTGGIRTDLDASPDSATGAYLGKDVRDTDPANNAIYAIRDSAESSDVTVQVCYEVEP